MSSECSIRTVVMMTTAIVLATAVEPAGGAAEAAGRAQDTGQESTITDIDGNVYHTVTIGSQVWLVENLRATRYRSGRPIPRVSED
ncbi:MAG TPA: hypothetical protein VLA34_04955, partial [Candidatus Krumholzibacterium sp.]|nr:hypothetical protein [Candidatus Krumholzibacterium sp.]